MPNSRTCLNGRRLKKKHRTKTAWGHEASSGPAATDKKCIPRLPSFQADANLRFLGRFRDSMTAAQIPPQQWVSRLRNILTGKVLRTFQDLSEDDKMSYITVRDKLLMSQNLTAEHYRQQFLKAAPTPEQSFLDYVLSTKNTFDRWLQLPHVSDYQCLYDLMIKNKVFMSCNVNLVTFLLERDPYMLTDLMKLGDQYYAVHPTSKVQKEVPFQAFACEGG